MAATPTLATQFPLQTKLKMDSRLDTKNLNSPLVSSGLICHRTVRHVTTLPPGIWWTTSTSSTAQATQDSSHPFTALRDTSSQTETVISCQHTAKEHNPAQSQNQSVSPPPQESKPVPFLIWQHSPHILPAADQPPLTPKPIVPFPQTWRHL